MLRLWGPTAKKNQKMFKSDIVSQKSSAENSAFSVHLEPVE
jgi:hypothetical protein